MKFIQKEKTCCFTGHRVIAKHDFKTIKEHLENEIETLINQGVQYFGCGGALGFDTLAAQMVVYLQKRYPHIKLIMVLPCKSQSDSWSENDKAEYYRILSTANKIVYTSQQYYCGCMHKRNRHLIDNSAFCIAYLRRNTGGTAYTISYAKTQGINIIII